MISLGFNLVTIGSDARYISAGGKADITKLKSKEKASETDDY